MFRAGDFEVEGKDDDEGSQGSVVDQFLPRPIVNVVVAEYRCDQGSPAEHDIIDVDTLRKLPQREDGGGVAEIDEEVQERAADDIPSY